MDATAVVPEPPKVSRIKSPGFVLSSISLRINATGFAWDEPFHLLPVSTGRKRTDIIYYVCGTNRNTLSTMKQNKFMYKGVMITRPRLFIPNEHV